MCAFVGHFENTRWNRRMLERRVPLCVTRCEKIGRSLFRPFPSHKSFFMQISRVASRLTTTYTASAKLRAVLVEGTKARDITKVGISPPRGTWAIRVIYPEDCKVCLKRRRIAYQSTNTRQNKNLQQNSKHWLTLRHHTMLLSRA